jgi:hypothetical protein
LPLIQPQPAVAGKQKYLRKHTPPAVHVYVIVECQRWVVDAVVC